MIEKDPVTDLFMCPLTAQGCNHPGSKRRFNLKIHWNMHLGDESRVFPCSGCSKLFRRKWDRDRHQKRHDMTDTARRKNGSRKKKKVGNGVVGDDQLSGVDDDHSNDSAMGNVEDSFAAIDSMFRLSME